MISLHHNNQDVESNSEGHDCLAVENPPGLLAAQDARREAAVVGPPDMVGPGTEAKVAPAQTPGSPWADLRRLHAWTEYYVVILCSTRVSHGLSP